LRCKSLEIASISSSFNTETLQTDASSNSFQTLSLPSSIVETVTCVESFEFVLPAFLLRIVTDSSSKIQNGVADESIEALQDNLDRFRIFELMDPFIARGSPGNPSCSESISSINAYILLSLESPLEKEREELHFEKKQNRRTADE
jgi:hypothetical protein